MFLLYLAVGLAFVPAGLLYALVGLVGWGNWLVAAVCLGFGFLMVHVVWTKLERRLTTGARRTAMREGRDDLQEEAHISVDIESPWLVRPTSSALAGQAWTSIQYIGEIPVPQNPRTEPTQALVMGQV
jgi:hypothetical protein